MSGTGTDKCTSVLGSPGRDAESRSDPGIALREETNIHDKEQKAVQAAGSTCAKVLGHK